MKKFLLVVVLGCGSLFSVNSWSQSLWSNLFGGLHVTSGLSGWSNPAIEAQAAVLSAKANNIDPQVLKLGLEAYLKAKADGLVQKPILTIIDYSKPATEPRLIVLDLQRNNVAFQVHVAHGKNSGNNFATTFSNKPNSLASSLGVFITGTTYQGKHGLSLRLMGLEKGFNDNALSRSIVVHGSNYVGPDIANRYGRIGRSWGCPAVNIRVAKPIINMIKNGSIVFAYYPDKRWLTHSAFLRV